MRVLLSNDDGILAPGLSALYAAVADMGQVDVVAPDSPQSAASHSITLRAPLSVQRVEIDGPPRLSARSVSGSPADCVRLAIRNLLSERPDLVLSGINAGANVGINVFYSGTVAAAAEAAMLGIPAVAFSADLAGQVDFTRAARLCRWVLEQLPADKLKGGDLINVNIPALGAGKPAGVRVVRQSTAGVTDVYVRQAAAGGAELYQLADEFGFHPRQDDTDVVALAEGYITVTPLHVDMTSHARLAELGKLHWNRMPPG